MFVYAEMNTVSHTNRSLLSFRNVVCTICSRRCWPVTGMLEPFFTAPVVTQYGRRCGGFQRCIFFCDIKSDFAFQFLRIKISVLCTFTSYMTEVSEGCNLTFPFCKNIVLHTHLHYTCKWIGEALYYGERYKTVTIIFNTNTWISKFSNILLFPRLFNPYYIICYSSLS